MAPQPADATPLPLLAAEAEARIRAALANPPLAALAPLLGDVVAGPEHAFALLSPVTYAAASTGHIAELKRRLPRELAGAEENLLERWLLLQAASHALPKVPALPLYLPVKRLLIKEFLFFAEAPGLWRPRFHAGDIRFREMARIATLQRLPAGQMHWERWGIPRRWLFKPALMEMLSLWKMVAFEFRGFRPVAETHTNDRREGGPHFRFEDRLLTYYRLTRSIELQPEMRGMMSESWYYCAETARVSPHLAWARQFFLDHGGIQVDLGPAPEDSGFLGTSRTRDRLYAEGLYKPKIGWVLWPRKRMLEWAARHPELAEE
jgi:hypothetical protein